MSKSVREVARVVGATDAPLLQVRAATGARALAFTPKMHLAAAVANRIAPTTRRSDPLKELRGASTYRPARPTTQAPLNHRPCEHGPNLDEGVSRAG